MDRFTRLLCEFPLSFYILAVYLLTELTTYNSSQPILYDITHETNLNSQMKFSKKLIPIHNYLETPHFEGHKRQKKWCV